MRPPVLLASFFALVCATLVQAAPRGVVVDGAGPWRDARWTLAVSEFTRLLTDAGYQVDTMSPVDLPSAQLAPDVVLAIPSFESLPLASFKAITVFLAAGGSLMASGGEPFRAPLYLTAGGKWLDQASILQTLATEKTVLDPVTATLSQFLYVPQTVAQTTVTGPDGQSEALDFQLQMPVSTQFYLLTAALKKPVFDSGQTATIVWTRGTPGQSMLFEWDETDGSRWIATVPLASQWTRQVLLPGDFQYWPSVPSRVGTKFIPVQADKFYFGVSSGPAPQPGPLEFAVSAIGVAAAPVFESFTAPVLETLSPAYKQFVTQVGGMSVRVPVARGRGLSATNDPDGRFRAIGDPRIPAATWYLTTSGTVIIWLPWPHLDNPQRAELVTLLSTAPNRLYLLNAGPTQIVALPGEDIVLGARVLNAARSPAQASLAWSIMDATGRVAAQSTVTLGLTAGELRSVPATDAGPLPSGDYTVTASLLIGTQETDRIVSRVRVFDPTLTYRPDQRIAAANGAFSTAGGRRLFLQGVNYWPRYTAGLEVTRFSQSWLTPQSYDPDLVEADLALLASLNFNLVSIQYRGADEARSLVDFLDRCRNHGIWAIIYTDVFIEGGTPAILYFGHLQRINPSIGSLLQAALLPGNDRVFAYDLLWEPYLGFHSDRVAIDSAWGAWITDQYGTGASAESIWGFTAPRNDQGELSNPLDDQIENDGPWRVMVAAYRRFIDDYLSRAFGVATRMIRGVAPGTLISYRSGGGAIADSDYALTAAGKVMLKQMYYELGTALAHLDFASPHAYFIPIPWPNGRGLGFAAAYARYRSGGKPVYWSEYGVNVGTSGENLATQTAICDSVMNLVNEDGSGASSVWWMPGGWRTGEQSDYGIFNPDGSSRDCADVLSRWGANFAAQPPTQQPGPTVTLTIDRDADARGDVGLFLRWQKDFVLSREAGSQVVLTDAGTGTDTSTMPLMQVGNVPYTGSGPLKYANGEFAGIHLQCPGVDVTIENGGQVQVPSGATCQVTPALVNTGSATWLPGASNHGVVLHTSVGDSQLPGDLPYLQRSDFSPLQVTAGQTMDITGRLNISGVGSFGEVLRLRLVAH